MIADNLKRKLKELRTNVAKAWAMQFIGNTQTVVLKIAAMKWFKRKIAANKMYTKIRFSLGVRCILLGVHKLMECPRSFKHQMILIFSFLKTRPHSMNQWINESNCNLSILLSKQNQFIDRSVLLLLLACNVSISSSDCERGSHAVHACRSGSSATYILLAEKLLSEDCGRN